MENCSYKVYAHINKINNKKYIGITKQDVNRRWRNGNGYKGCITFNNAIEKYGWDNFEHIIIKENLPKECAETLEKILIYLYDTQHNGYNLDGGGNVHLASKESKRKSSESHKGKRLADTTKEKLRQSTLLLWKDPVYRAKCVRKKGYTRPPLTEVQKNQISASVKKLWENPEYASVMRTKLIKARKVKPVKMISKDGSYTVFKSVNEALKYLGKKDKSNIYHHLKGDCPTAYGYRWEYLGME